MTIEASIEASCCGNLDLLKWIYEYNWIWDTRISEIASLNGHIEILKWLNMKNCYG